MKKLLLGLGSAVTVVAPIATVVSCNNNDSTKGYKDHMVSIINAFNEDKKGGSDVSKEFQNTDTEIKRINDIADVTKLEKELKDFYKKVLPAFNGVTYAGPSNGVTFATLIIDAHDFSEMFQDISTLADTLTTDEEAKEYGLTKEGAKNVSQIAIKISSADFAEAKSLDGVKIGDQLDNDAKALVQPMYLQFAANVSSIYEIIHKDYTESLGKGDDSKEFKSFILNLSKVLNDMSQSHLVNKLNEFVSTTKDSTINNWKTMFEKISSIASSFSTEKTAEEYGFDSLQEAESAGRQSDMLSKVKKGTSATDDNKRITIDK